MKPHLLVYLFLILGYVNAQRVENDAQAQYQQQLEEYQRQLQQYYKNLPPQKQTYQSLKGLGPGQTGFVQSDIGRIVVPDQRKVGPSPASIPTTTQLQAPSPIVPVFRVQNPAGATLPPQTSQVGQFINIQPIPNQPSMNQNWQGHIPFRPQPGVMSLQQRIRNPTRPRPSPPPEDYREPKKPLQENQLSVQNAPPTTFPFNTDSSVKPTPKPGRVKVTKHRVQPTAQVPFTSEEPFDEEEARKQAEGAKYAFESGYTDSINDNSHVRQEVRDGLQLKGLYSYSDGYFKRTVFYVADENGYRVVKEESEPIGDGPLLNPEGVIKVNTNVDGAHLQYSINGLDLQKRKQQQMREEETTRKTDQKYIGRNQGVQNEREISNQYSESQDTFNLNREEEYREGDIVRNQDGWRQEDGKSDSLPKTPVSLQGGRQTNTQGRRRPLARCFQGNCRQN